MATYLVFGKRTPEARQACHTKRTRHALGLIKKHGGAFDTPAAA